MSRAEPVAPDKAYPLLGAHWYAKGLYTKEVKAGSAIRAGMVYCVNEGDFVYNRLFAWMGSFALATGDNDGCYVSNEFLCFELDPESVDGEYLWCYFSRPATWKEALGLSTGSTPTSRNRLKQEQFLKMLIPLPSLAEQRSLANTIRSLQRHIRKGYELRSQTREAAAGLLGAVIDAELDALQAEGHPITTVGQVAEVVTSGPRNFGSRYVDAGVRFYRAQDVGPDGQIVDDAVVYVEVPTGMTTRATVKEGDILVVITGATIGRAAYIHSGLPTGLVSQHVGLIRVDPARVIPRFLHYAMLSPKWAGGQLVSARYGQGKPGVNLNNLRALSFPVPPMEEQHRAVKDLDGIRGSVELIREWHRRVGAEWEALDESILAVAFDGTRRLGWERCRPHRSDG